MISKLISTYINNVNDPKANYDLALYYESIGQYASAVSYYLRCAERSDDRLLQYECLLRCARCFEHQGTRRFTVRGILQQAVALLPTRPEAYYYLSRILEGSSNGDGRWFDSYTYASIGLSIAQHSGDYILDYPGSYALLFQKAVAAWWCGLCDDSRNMFLDLHCNYDLDKLHADSVCSNLARLGGFASIRLDTYDSKTQKLKYVFSGSEHITHNYSEAHQDLFTLYIHDGKHTGTYLEIGAGQPHYGNNTALLENLGWGGISIDIDQSLVNSYNNMRRNKCLCADATTLNYGKLLLGFEHLDYVQIDCDPAQTSLAVLKALPLDRVRAAVLTFEHDAYIDRNSTVRRESREHLRALGYELVVSNIAPDSYRAYEDWWVYPDLVDASRLQRIKDCRNNTKYSKEFMTCDKILK